MENLSQMIDPRGRDHKPTNYFDIGQVCARPTLSTAQLEEDVKFFTMTKASHFTFYRYRGVLWAMWHCIFYVSCSHKLQIIHRCIHTRNNNISGNFSISHSTQRTIDDEQHTTMSNCQFTALFMLSILRVHVQWSVKLVENVNIFVQHTAPRRLSMMSHVCKRRREVHKSIKLLGDLVVVSSVWSTKTTIWKRK